MDEKLMRELLDELLSAMEGLEAQNLAVMQFLKAQKKGTEKLAPFLEQAEKTSGVKWMAAKARLFHLLDAASKEPERSKEAEAEKSAGNQTNPEDQAPKVEESSKHENVKSKEVAVQKNEELEKNEKTSEPKASPSGEAPLQTVDAAPNKQTDTNRSIEEAGKTTENAA